MEALVPWLTPALLVVLFTWLRRDIGEFRRRVRELNKCFDDVTREFVDLRGRMAKLEGSLDGFLAGGCDRHVA